MSEYKIKPLEHTNVDSLKPLMNDLIEVLNKHKAVLDVAHYSDNFEDLYIELRGGQSNSGRIRLHPGCCLSTIYLTALLKGLDDESIQ